MKKGDTCTVTGLTSMKKYNGREVELKSDAIPTFGGGVGYETSIKDSGKDYIIQEKNLKLKQTVSQRIKSLAS